MGIKFFVLFFLLSTVLVTGLTEEEKVYFDSQNQKTVQQINAKIDQQTQAVQNNIKAEVDNARAQIKSELSSELKSGLKSVGIGLAGMIVVALALFKIADLNITHNKNIKKYEQELRDKGKELDDMIAKTKKEMDDYMKGIGYKEQQKPLLTVPRPNKFPFKVLVIGIAVVTGIAVIGGLVYFLIPK